MSHDSDQAGGPLRPSRAPLIWFDLTTSLRSRRGQSNGTLRVERSYALALRTILGDQLRFCRYDPLRRQFIALPGLPEAIAPRPTSQAGHGVGVVRERSDHLGKRIERALRRTARGGAGYLLQSWNAGARRFPAASPGEALILAGETWGAQFDLDVLRTMRAQENIRLVAVCQDFIPIKLPQYFAAGDFLTHYRRYADFLARDVDLLLAISKSTRADILECSGGAAGRVEVVQLGADVRTPAPGRPPREWPHLAPGSFVLSISTMQSRKNFDLLYRLWRRFAEERRTGIPMLLMVGQRGFGTNDLLFQIHHDPLVQDTVKLLHGVSDEELDWLYQNCRYTLYPSVYEGWGLPISESLAYGKFCLASNTSSLPEAGEGLIEHLDPFDFAGWHEAVVRLAADPGAVAQAEARIRARYRVRTWAESAADVAGLVRGLLDEDRAGPQRHSAADAVVAVRA